MPTISLYFGRDFKDPKWAGVTYKLDCPSGHRRGSEWLLGRAPDSDLTIEVKNISRKHAAISYSYIGNNWSIQDLGSNAGTTLNGIFLKQGDLYPLKIGDRFYLADNRINVVEDEQDTINDIFPPTVASGVSVTEWPTPTTLPAPPAPADPPAPPPSRSWADVAAIWVQWAISGQTALGKAYRLIVAVVVSAVAVVVLSMLLK